MNKELPLNLSPKSQVNTDFRTLLAIIGGAMIAAMGWAHLEMKVSDHQGSIEAIQAVQKTDHDILIRLDQRTEWLGRNRQASSIPLKESTIP